MKLKYQISEKSALEVQTIKETIYFELKESDYNVENISENTIRFSNNTKGWGLSGNQAAKMDKGIFEILELEGEKLITLTYYKTFTQYSIFLAIFLLLSFFGDHWILFLVGGGILFMLIDLFFTKMKCEEMVDRIISVG